MALFVGCCKCSLCPQKFMSGYVQSHIAIVREANKKERGRGVAWHCKYHFIGEKATYKEWGDFDTVTDFFNLAGFSIIIIVGWFVELLRAQKYVVRRQCDNTDVWTVPYNGSSSIILSVI